jgi:hypothetical protein
MLGMPDDLFATRRIRLELMDGPDEDVDFDFDELRNYLMQCKEYNPGYIFYEKPSHWPSIRRKRPDRRKLSDSVLASLLNSVYTALENDLGVLSTIGMGVVFERAAELIGIDPNRNFTEKLNDLHLGGNISAVERQRLEVLTNVRGAAAHRGWVPDPEQLNILIGIMEHFVSGLILKEEAGKLKAAIPTRQKRRKGEPRQKPAQLIELRPTNSLSAGRAISVRRQDDARRTLHCDTLRSWPPAKPHGSTWQSTISSLRSAESSRSIGNMKNCITCFLGAGFSYVAGVPLARNLLKPNWGHCDVRAQSSALP